MPTALTAPNAHYTLVPTLDVLGALQSVLEGLELPAPFAGQKAFATVHAYAHENLKAALDDLLIFDDRACLIVPTGTKHTNERDGRVLTSRQETEFVLLITDRVYGGQFEAEAALGNSETPGMIALADLVVAKLAGQSLGLPLVCLQPIGGQPLRYSNKERSEMEGRECWAQEFSTPAGELRVTRQRPGQHTT